MNLHHTAGATRNRSASNNPFASPRVTREKVRFGTPQITATLEQGDNLPPLACSRVAAMSMRKAVYVYGAPRCDGLPPARVGQERAFQAASPTQAAQ